MSEFKIDPQTGLLHGASFLRSPNYNERPPGQDISLLVIHGISLPPGQFGSRDVHEFFTNQLKIDKHPYFSEIAHLKVSSHFFIRRDGELWQFVPLTKRAWHAGQSSFQGRENCNDFSIGIELEGTDELPYAPEQYEQLAQVTCAVMSCYPKITLENIVGHSDIAPSRKTDPGPSFDWHSYREHVIKLLANKPKQSKN